MRLIAGDSVGAVTDARKSAVLLEELPSRSVEEWYELACCHAAFAAAAGREGSGMSAGDGETEADKAMTLLRKVVADGYRNLNAVTRESAFEPLRNRPDFKLLMLDLALPADPFAQRLTNNVVVLRRSDPRDEIYAFEIGRARKFACHLVKPIRSQKYSLLMGESPLRDGGKKTWRSQMAIPTVGSHHDGRCPRRRTAIRPGHSGSFRPLLGQFSSERADLILGRHAEL